MVDTEPTTKTKKIIQRVIMNTNNLDRRLFPDLLCNLLFPDVY